MTMVPLGTGVEGQFQLMEQSAQAPDLTSWWQDILSAITPGTQWNMGEVSGQVQSALTRHGGAWRAWDTGTAKFWACMDGWTVVLGNNGVLRDFKRRAPIVLKREPTIRELDREIKRVRVLSKAATRVYRFIHPQHNEAPHRGRR